MKELKNLAELEDLPLIIIGFGLNSIEDPNDLCVVFDSILITEKL